MTDYIPLIYMLGHSDRSIEDFMEMLESSEIRILVDIRSHPESKRSPHFSMDNLGEKLVAAGIVYQLAGRQLGGLRQAQENSQHMAITDEKLRAYADYMETDAFKKGAVQLLNLAAKGRTAVLCAEKLPEHCHRSLLADYLTLNNVHVLHLLEKGQVTEHQLDPRARRESGELVYDQMIVRH
jgi:uncharacterized protein (DUF488 family)